MIKIAIASGKGGTGKTTVAVNLSIYFQSLKKNSIQLIDCDVEEPNSGLFLRKQLIDKKPVKRLVPVVNEDKCTYCGECANICEFNAIMMLKELKHIQIMDDLCKSCGACLYACKYDALTEKEDQLGEVSRFKTEQGFDFIEGRIKVGNPFAVPVISQTKKQIFNKEITIIDAPPGTSCPTIEAMHGMDFVILVAEPTPFGLSDLKLMVETVRKTNHEFAVVINKAGIGTLDIYDYLSEENIEIIAEIPFNKEYARCYSNGGILIEEFEEVKKVFEKISQKLKLN